MLEAQASTTVCLTCSAGPQEPTSAHCNGQDTGVHQPGPLSECVFLWIDCILGHF